MDRNSIRMREQFISILRSFQIILVLAGTTSAFRGVDKIRQRKKIEDRSQRSLTLLS